MAVKNRSESREQDYAPDGWLVVGLVVAVVGALTLLWCVVRPLVWWLIRKAAALVRWHPWVALALVLSVLGLIESGPVGLLGWWTFVGCLFLLWWCAHESSFNRLARTRFRSGWRREWVYGRRWRQAMFLSGLGSRFDGGEVYAQLGRVRSTWACDVVAIRLAMAQEPRDWERVSERLAQSFGALGCRIHPGSPGRVLVEFTTRRREAIVPPLPVPAVPNLERLAIGRRGDGTPWELRLAQTHVLVAGATGSGKGSVVWSLIRSLASGVHEGWVQLWAIDPKGGMELAAGEPMFTRFATESEGIAQVLEDAVALLHARAARLRGVTRQHSPTVEEPAVVVIVDEMAALSGYEQNAELRRRIARDLGILASQGRALSIHLVALLQDPRKEVIPFRDLFPTRICLRMTEAEQVDWVLGRGSRERGAAAERIPETSPGCGYVLLDGRTTPVWVRASWVSDADIEEMARTYPAPAPVVDLAVVEDQADDDEGESDEGQEVAA
jgi:S-DNA-T family DNA segregation ATPase FtsK/SpoIIIE